MGNYLWPNTEIKHTHNNLEIVVEHNDQNNIQVQINDKSTLRIYKSQWHLISKINLKTIKLAFQGNDKNVSFYLDADKTQTQMVLKIIVSIPFIPVIQQQIKCKLIKQPQKQQIYNHIRRRVKQTRQIDIDRYVQKHIFINNNENIGNNNLQQVGSLEIPKGKYLVTMSFILFSDNSSFAFVKICEGSSQKYLSQMKDFQGFYCLPNTYTPIILRFQYKNNLRNNKISLHFTDINGQGCQIFNFIITAVPIV